MLAWIKHRFFEDQTQPPLVAAVPEGHRVYAVGDIHGRSDLFGRLIEVIEEDDLAAGPAETTIVLLGDLVDRGADSAGVLEMAREWQERRRVRILAGNHEEMFLASFDDAEVLRHFLRHGGRETVLSFGIDPDTFRKAALHEVQAMMAEAVPRATRDFIEGFEDLIILGDYMFVHAGIDPSLPHDAQTVETLRWIREPFLSHGAPHAHVVVHGHSISKDVEDRGNRIGIDTGAYASGRLTALVLEDTQRRYLGTTQNADGSIEAGPRSVAA